MSPDASVPAPDDESIPPLPSEEEWPDDGDPLDDGWEDLHLEAPAPRPAIDWDALEVEQARILPAGLSLAGRTESARVDVLGAGVLQARLDTAARQSRIHGVRLDPGSGEPVRWTVDGQERVLPARCVDGEWFVEAEVRLGGRRLQIVFAVDPGPGAVPLSIGADDLAGVLVVDPGQDGLLGEPR